MSDIELEKTEIEQLLEKVRKLKRELRIAYANNEKRNIQLDALHFVWCDGGCGSGVHRWTSEELTAEIVAEAILNTNRLESWYINSEGRKANPGGGGYTTAQAKPLWDKAKAAIKKAMRTKLEKENEQLRAELRDILET